MNDQTPMTDDEFRAWMYRNLARAAEHFGLVVHGLTRWGWNLRSVGTAATGPRGRVWLRVGTERDSDLAEPGLADIWTGIPDSGLILGVPKPVVLDSIEWTERMLGRHVRADVTTAEPGRPCSPGEALRSAIDLPDQWWTELRRAVDTVQATTTTRYAAMSTGGGRVRAVFGAALADRLGPIERATAHGDLHWNNLFQPDLRVMDWELWGLYPSGHDAATLYLFALQVPDVAARVHDTFADQLDTRAGAVAQLGVAARILLGAKNGDHADLVSAVNEHIATTGLVDRVARDATEGR